MNEAAELFEPDGAIAEKARGSSPVAVLLVVEAYPNLQDALIEEADLLWLLHPGFF